MPVNTEIERKFLITNLDKIPLTRGTRLQQGYLSSSPERSVRIRVKDNKGFLTIKGKSNLSGMSRLEWEKEIDLEDAQQLLTLCESSIIDKTRYRITWDNKIIELDIFHGDNEGLIIAEVELETELEHFAPPPWFDKEVTGNKKYYNASLSKFPFKNWTKETP